MTIAKVPFTALRRTKTLDSMGHSVRLFPKGRGADAYRLSGIAALCDWVICSDTQSPQIHLTQKHRGQEPRHIFLSLRSPKIAIEYFVTEVLPTILGSFVLVTGSEDVTLPNQTDQRWEPFDAKTRGNIDAIARHPLLRHWFAENLDEKWTTKVSPLPTGFVYPNTWRTPPLYQPKVPKLRERALSVLCGHRVREGRQWEPRRIVTQLAHTEWRDFTRLIEKPVSERVFLSIVKECSFVLCVEGGGIDPSPKAWQALQYGAIPIMKRSPVSEAYSALPGIFVDEWSSDALNREKLLRWRLELIDKFDDVNQRDELLSRLSISYWWKMISSATRID